MTFFRDENGQGMVEYALIIGLIAVAIIFAVVLIRRAIQNKMESASSGLGGNANTATNPDAAAS